MTATIAPSHPFLITGEQDFALSSIASDYTVAQAAQLLDMPEDCIDELLDVGILQARYDGDRRLVDREHLLEHNRDRKRMQAGVLEIIRLDEEMGLYDD